MDGINWWIYEWINKRRERSKILNGWNKLMNLWMDEWKDEYREPFIRRRMFTVP